MRRFNNLLFVMLAVITLFTSCKEEEINPDPTISFTTDAGYNYNDVAAKLGDTVLVGISAVSNDIEKLSMFTITANDQIVYSESNLAKHEYEVGFNIIKNQAEEEEWKFIIEDVEGKSANVSITLTREYGEIGGFGDSPLVLGAQDNTTYGSFFSIELQELFDQAGAFEYQSNIDILYYYDEVDLNTIGAAGSNIGSDIFTGTTGLDNWTVFNETRYYRTSLNFNDFDAIENDGAIIANYDANEAKRKAKGLAVGDIYTFKTGSGVYGIFEVVSVDGQAEGSLGIIIKYQI